MTSDLSTEFTCHNRLDYRTIMRQFTSLFHLAQQIVHKNCTGLITGQNLILARRIFDHSTHTISIRICTNKNIRAHLLPQFNRKLKRFPLLRVWRFHRRELSIWLLLLLNDMHLSES
ncbi:hypothetical protein D3C77_541220 [compost metagenome]